MRKVLTVFGCVFVLALVNCGSSDIGESCDDEGKTSGCVDDAVCTKNKSGSLVCAKMCSSFSDCSGSQQCTGVSQGSLKACVDN